MSAGNEEEREGIRGRSSGDWADKANRLLHLQFSFGRRKEGAMKFILGGDALWAETYLASCLVPNGMANLWREI